MNTSRILISTLLAFSLTPGLNTQAAPVDGLDAQVTNIMAQWGMPGLSLAVVKDDAVVCLKGYGVRRAGAPDPVDADTLMPIASCSKAFTATAVGLMVQDGRLAWDDPVTRHLPFYRLYSSDVTARITVRDLLSMRGGYNNSESENLWYGTDLDRAAIVRRLRFVSADSQAPLGVYAYRNTLYLTAGQVIPAVSGQTWDQVLTNRIFLPLGMTRTRTSVTQVAGMPNVASPHWISTNRIATPIDLRPIDNCAPAGAVISSARDMAQWVRMQLNEGLLDGQQIVNADIIRETHTPQTMDSANSNVWYCLGWATYSLFGHTVVSHAGELDGAQSLVTLMPDLNLGLVILDNGSWNWGFSALAHTEISYWILEAYLGLSHADYTTGDIQSKLQQEAAQDADMQRIYAERVPDTVPSLDLNAYVMNYANPIFGRVRIEWENGKLVYRHSTQHILDLNHWHYDMFLGASRSNIEPWPYFVYFSVANSRVTNFSDFVYNYRPAYDGYGGQTVGDYDGDGRADPTLFQASLGLWRTWRSTRNYTPLDNLMSAAQGWLPATADYDGDRLADPAIFDPAHGDWIVHCSSQQFSPVHAAGFLGSPGMLPAPADYDGDGRADPAVFDPSTGTWIVRFSSQQYTLQIAEGLLGSSSSLPAAADYDGDRRADPAVYNPVEIVGATDIEGCWRVKLSSPSYAETFAPGLVGDLNGIPVAADYDGDGKADPAVYNEATGQWTLRRSSYNYEPVTVVLEE